MLSEGLHDVPEGMVANVVTHLQMLDPPAERPVPDQPDLSLAPIDTSDLDAYRALFRHVGQDWLWFGRLRKSEGELREILEDPAYEAFALELDGQAQGLLELDFRQPGHCELGYFGLGPGLIGRGAGRWLMAEAIRRAWRPGVNRFWVHTCTLDSPQALMFYVRSGFTPFRQEVEVAPDPRLTGDLPRDAAPQFPIIEPAP